MSAENKELYYITDFLIRQLMLDVQIVVKCGVADGVKLAITPTIRGQIEAILEHAVQDVNRILYKELS